MANQATYSVATLCRVLGVSPSGYYAWRNRAPSRRKVADAELTVLIRKIHCSSRRTYGAPRVHAELSDQGFAVSRKRVARLMRSQGLQGASRRRWIRTTVRQEKAHPAPDLVKREFTAPAPNQLWVADITYVPTWEGFLFLAVVLDVFSRRVVGWAMASHMKTDLVLAALTMAVQQRNPSEVVHHSDQGSQYTSFRFGSRCRTLNVRQSMGTVGDCFDNAMCESFFASLECELLWQNSFRSRQEARLAVFDFIEGWYNTHRRHSALDYMSPLAYERMHALAS